MGLGHSKPNEPVTSNVTPVVFNENVQQSSDNINKVVQEISTLIGNAGFKGAEDIPNPESFVDVNSDNQLEFYGGTFSVDANLQETLVGSLEESLSAFSDNEEFTGGADKSTEVKVLRLLHDGISKLNNEYGNISNAINDKITTLHSLQVFLKKGLNKLSNLVDNNKSEAKVITEVQEALLKEIDRQLILLQNLIKVNVKPTKESLTELLKKNKNFTNLAETLGTSYNTEEASDRLALVFTNISQLGLAAENVKEALKTLNISLKEYSNVKDVKTLESKIASVMKNVKGKKVNELNDIMKAIKVLKNNHISHDHIVKCLENSKNCNVSKKGGQEDVESFFDNEGETFEGSLDTESVDAFFDNEGETFEGGDYTKQVGRVVKQRSKSALSTRVKTYEQTMKELYRSFMNQVNSNFKELSTLFDMLSNKIGSEISYDEDLQIFIRMISGLNESLDNEKIFYALISLNHELAGKELKDRFNDNLNKIIVSSDQLKNYKIFTDITKVLKSFKENIDTYSDTVTNLQKSEGQKTGSNEEFMWTDKLLDVSFSINNIKLIKNSIKKLTFFGKVSSIKQNLLRMNKEHKVNQEDYDKLLGKSIAVKLSELNKEYVENIDRLNDKTRGRGLLLERYNSGKKPDDDNYLPRGLVENIYKIQYEAREGLYKTIEAVDLYLMNFTELLSGHPEAIMDLNKMLEQTEIIAKWFNKKSVDNLTTLFEDQIVPETDNSKIIQDVNNIIKSSLNLREIKFNKTLMAKNIKVAYEQCKKAINSISTLKNIISMFVHIGEKFGNEKLTSKLLMAPNLVYKNLLKYIWVSAFTMGYGTAGGNLSDEIVGQTKGEYELERGDFSAYYDILFSTIVLPLDVYKEIENKVFTQLDANSVDNVEKALVKKVKDRLQNRDLFIVDDKYFILTVKAMVGKIFTVIDTHSLLKTPAKLENIMRNPVRTVIGANASPKVIPEAMELYVRLPLLVEFYKHIFDNGNNSFKYNKNKTLSDLEVIAFIPEIGTIWSGLIQCIFDESRYIDQGIYSINNMKNIVYEINNIYTHYAKTVSKDKLVRTVVLDLIAEVNRRYGILKEKDIAEFYQIKKKYTKFPGDMTLDENVNFDILDENNEYQLEGPSSMYVEKYYNKLSNESAMSVNDIKMVKDFRNKIYNELFADINTFKDLSTKSFNEKIKFYKNQLHTSSNDDKKFELIASAIDQSSNINAYNVDVYLLFHEYVLNQIDLLDFMYNYVYATIAYFKDMHQSRTFSKLSLLSESHKYFNDNNLFKIKMISNKKFIIDYSNLQTVTETFIENIKYMLSKFRTTICKEIFDQYETRVYQLENNFLNIIIKDDNNSEGYATLTKSVYTLEQLNINNNLYFNNDTVTDNVEELYRHIVFGNNTTATLLRRTNPLLVDVAKTYNPQTRTWANKNNMNYLDYVLPNDDIKNNNSFVNKSILQKFNMLIFTYLEQFYNSSTKKIYSKLFDEFANKSMSAVIFEQGGIPDIFEQGGINNIENINYADVNNNNVLSMTIVVVLRTLLTRNTNVQLPIKYHLLDNISDVSSVQLEKYKAYLPLFVTYFEHLIEEALVYKKILDSPHITFGNNTNNLNVSNVLQDPNNYNITDDTGNVVTFSTALSTSNGNANNSKTKFHEMLNNIINGSRSIINDAKTVLAEINYVPQFGNLRDNFIKNFYNNNNQLPYIPISILNKVVDYNTSSINLLPVHAINSDLNKYIYATNYILNNPNNLQEQDVNNYLWLKEQTKDYNNSALSTNTIDTKKINSLLTGFNSIINYGYIAQHVHTNLYYSSNVNPAAPRVPPRGLPAGGPAAPGGPAGLPYGGPSPAAPGPPGGLPYGGPAPAAPGPPGGLPYGGPAAPGGPAPAAPGGPAPAAPGGPVPGGPADNPCRATDTYPTEADLIDALDALLPLDNANRARQVLRIIRDVHPDRNLGCPEASNRYIRIATNWRDVNVAAAAFVGGFYFTQGSVSMNKLINIIENQLNENKKHEIVKDILGTVCTRDPTLREYNLDRKRARILNIIDLNVMPINIHALLREVPLINIYNYAAAFDDTVSLLFNINPDAYKVTDVNKQYKDYELLGVLLQDPYYINPYINENNRYQNLVKEYLSVPENSKTNLKNVYLSAPKYLVNVMNNMSSKANTQYDLVYNNKFLRNVLFLVNIQRVIRLKLKSAVYVINNNVVSNNNLMNMRITEFVDKNETSINDDEFEIADLI